MPYFDQEFGEELDRVFKEKFDLLLGRNTYEIFAAYWPYYDENPPHGSIAINYVTHDGVMQSPGAFQ
jgi:dihydrofolate reductase